MKALLEKIPAELISINSRDLAEVNVEKLHQTLEERKAKKGRGVFESMAERPLTGSG